MSIFEMVRFLFTGKRPDPNDSTPSRVWFTEQSATEEDPKLNDDWTFEATIPLNKVAALYLENQWLWGHTKGVPSRQQIASFIALQTVAIDENPNAVYSTSGRLLFLKDEEFPGAVDVYLHVGTAERTDNDNDVEGVIVD